MNGIKIGINLKTFIEVVDSEENPESLLNVKDNDKRTLLMIAALKNRDDIINVLVAKYNADINEVDNAGMNALAIAEGFGSKNAIKILKKITIEQRDILGHHHHYYHHHHH